MIIYIINTIIILMLTSAFMTVWSHNPIYAAFYLCVSFILAAGFLLLFNFEFVALILIIVYVGAIAVLFLFVIYMIDVKLQSLNFSNFFYFYCLFFSLFSFLELFVLLFKHFCTNPYLKEQIYFNAVFYSNWILENDTLFDLNLIGQYLSANLAIHLLLTGLILFLGVLGSISIIFSFNFSKTKQQQIFKQLSKRNNFHFVGAIVQEESFENLFSLIFMTFLEQGLLPEIFIGSSCIIFLIFYLITSINYKTKYPLLSKPLIMLCQLIVFDSLLLIFNDNLIWFYMFHTFNTISSYCFLNSFIKFFVLLLTLFCFFLMERYIIKHQNTHIGEYFILLLFSLLGILLTITLNDLLSLYLSIEMQSLAFYTLTAFKKKSLYSIENGLKYLILGAVSSSFFLFGACYLYGLTGLFNIFDFSLFWFINQVPNQVSSYFVFWETNNVTLLILSCLLSSITFLHFLYLCLYSEFYDFFEFDSLEVLWVVDDRLSYLLTATTHTGDSGYLCEIFYDDFYEIYQYYSMQDLKVKPFQSEASMQSLSGYSEHAPTVLIEYAPFLTFPGSDVWISIINKLDFLTNLYKKTVSFKTAFDSDNGIETLFDFIDNASDLDHFVNNFLQKMGDDFNIVYSNAKKIFEASGRSFVTDCPEFCEVLIKDKFFFDKLPYLKDLTETLYPNFIKFYDDLIKFKTCFNSKNSFDLINSYKKNNASDDLFYRGDQLLKSFKYILKDYFEKHFLYMLPYITMDEAIRLVDSSFESLDISTLEDEEKKYKKMISVYNLFQEVSDYEDLSQAQYDEIFKKLVIEDIVERLVKDNEIFFFYLENIWKDELFGESLCLENISVATNKNLSFREFDNFQVFIMESLNTNMLMLIKKMEHLETIKSVIDLLLSENKSEEISNAILKVSKKNIALESHGKKIFFDRNNDDLESVSFISKFAINYAIENLDREILNCYESYQNLYKIIEVSDSGEFNYALKSLLYNKNNASDDLFYKGDQLLKSFKYILKDYFEKHFLYMLPYITMDEAIRLVDSSFESLDISTLEDEEKKYKKMISVYNLFQEVSDYEDLSQAQYDEIFKKLVIEDIVERLVKDNEIFFFYLENIWKDELFGESLCLENVSVATNKDLSFREFDNFQVFIMESLNTNMLMLIKKMEHLETIKSVIDLLLSENKSEEISNAILKVSKKNIALESHGKKIFFDRNNDDLESVSFISKFAINYAIENLDREILNCYESYQNLYKIIEVSDSGEFNYALKSLLYNKNNASDDLFYKGDQLLKSFKYILKDYFEKHFLYMLPYITMDEAIRLVDSSFESLDISTLEDEEKKYKKMISVYNLFQEVSDYEDLSQAQYDEIFKKLVIEDIVERLVKDNEIFFFYLENIWKDELFGESLCLENVSVATNKDLSFREFDNFQVFIMESLNTNMLMLIKKMEHLETIKSVIDLLLSENKSEEISNAILKVSKKNIALESHGKKIFFDRNNDDLESVSFISKFAINYAIENLDREILNCYESYQNLYKIIEVSDSGEFNYALKSLLYNKNFVLYDYDSIKLHLNNKFKFYDLPSSWVDSLINLFILRNMSEHAIPELKKNIRVLEELFFHLMYRLQGKPEQDYIDTFLFYDPKEDSFIKAYMNIFFKNSEYNPAKDEYGHRLTAEDQELPENQFIIYAPTYLRAYCLMKLDKLISSIKDNSSINIQREIRALLRNQQISNVEYTKFVRDSLVLAHGLSDILGEDQDLLGINVYDIPADGLVKSVMTSTCYECFDRPGMFYTNELLEFEKINFFLNYYILKCEQFPSVIPNTFFDPNTVFYKKILFSISIPVLLNVYALEFLENESIKTSILTQTYSFSTISLIFILISLLFKLASAPFHNWSIDVYEAAPTSSTLIFTVIPKLSIIVLMTKFYFFSFYFFFINNLYQYVILTALLSIFISSIAGVSEKKLKSLFAYSAINNIGYILISMSTGTSVGLQALYFYLFIYTVSNFVIWSILIALQTKKTWYIYKLNKDFTDLLAIKKTNPILVYIFKIVLISIAGIPPLIGFLIKLNIFLSVMEASSYLLSVIVIFFNLISTFYYLRFLKILHFEKAFLGKLHENINSKQAYVICFFFFLLLYFYIRPWFIVLSTYKIILY